MKVVTDLPLDVTRVNVKLSVPNAPGTVTENVL